MVSDGCNEMPKRLLVIGGKMQEKCGMWIREEYTNEIDKRIKEIVRK
jgi:hypothetical protein